MKYLDAASLRRVARVADLIAPLRQAFTQGGQVPVRAHHPIAMPEGHPAMLLMMPAWRSGGALGVKLATVFPENGKQGLPSVYATYVLMAGDTGAPLAILDGGELTRLRTAAVSGLAADYLARSDAEHLLMVGTGALIPYLIDAHRAVRPIQRVSIWGRDPAKATALAARLQPHLPMPVTGVADLAAAAAEADIVSSATLSRAPLVHGAWLRPGTHLDLVGAFTPEMRETDDHAVTRARLYADTRDGVLAEAGDILIPLKAGLIDAESLLGDLADLTQGRVGGRATPDQITLFKSVGTALADLAAAEWISHRAGEA